tara:strand:- start:875 stop:2161 length:1287 start_codon:yes stop_codon:yes gene_type:complete
MFSLAQPQPRFVLVAILLLPITTLAQQEETTLPDLWTLGNSIQRVLDIAPEIKTAEAKVNARQGALQQAGAWPNPTISVQSDDKLGIEDGSGGNDITQYAFSQPLPLSGRLSHQKAIASEALQGAKANRRYQRLVLEQQTAMRFRQLQLTTANLELAEQRLKLADELKAATLRREQAGELSKLERLRLGLVREEAQQILDKAEGEYNEALSQYRAYLGLPSTVNLTLTPLSPLESVPPLATFEMNLADQPLFVAAQHRIGAAQSNVKLSQASRWPDPVLSVFQEEDFLGGRRQKFIGIGLSITVPLWDRKSGQRSQSLAEVSEAQSDLNSLRRDITSRVRQSYIHLKHLVQQAAHYRARVFEPAREVLELTNKAYLSGEVEILSLIDANSTYFNAHTRYLGLLQLAWIEMAELQLTAGRSSLNTEQEK